MTGTEAALLVLPCSLATVATVVVQLASSQLLATVVTFNDVAFIASYQAALVPSRFTAKSYRFCCIFSLLSYWQDPAVVQILGFLLDPMLVTAKCSFIWSFKVQPDISVSVRC